MQNLASAVDSLPAPTGPADDGWRGRALRAENMLSIGGKEKNDAKLFLMRAMLWRVQDIGGPEEPGFVEVVQEAAHRLYQHQQAQARLDAKPKQLEIVSHDQRD